VKAISRRSKWQAQLGCATDVRHRGSHHWAGEAFIESLLLGLAKKALLKKP
jgi:hypothetical protein